MEFFKIINPSVIGKALVIFTIISIATMVWMMKLGKPLQKGSILALELVLSEKNAEKIMDKWGENEKKSAIAQTYVDFLFILGYSVSISCLWLLIIHYQSAQPWSGFFQFVGAIFILFVILAGLYDVVENIYLIKVINGNGHPAPIITTVFAFMKWLLVLPALFTGIVIGIYTLIIQR